MSQTTHHNDVAVENLVEIEQHEQLDAGYSTSALAEDDVVRVGRHNYSVYELLRMEKNGRLVLSPAFQRRGVWQDDVAHN
jgi:hypothetical protein